MKTVLIIGVRRKCYQAALKLGYQVVLWSDGPLHESRKNKLKGWIEVPYQDCSEGLNDQVKSQLQSHQFLAVIANSEETVVLGSRVRQYLGLKSLATDVVQRFHNKFIMKNAAKDAGIPITNYELIREDTSAGELVEKLGLPLVIKPVDESGAQDVQVARTPDEVHAHMRPGLLAESFVEGSEVSVETFIQGGKPIFHNVTDYLHQWKKSVVPAVLESDLHRQIIELNDRVIQAFGVDRGMTHAEFYLSPKGPVFGEIAIRPPGGYYMELIQRVYGFDTWKTFIKLACHQKVGQIDSVPQGFAGVVMFHPGKGTIRSISGEAEVREHLSEIIELKIRKKPGDAVTDHVNTSNEVGHILFWEQTREDLLEAIECIEKIIQFDLSSE